MSSHRAPSIEECIEMKFSKALHKRLRKQINIFKSHPELKESAIDAFINSRGYFSKADNHLYKCPGMTISDLRRLLDLVDRGVFTLDDIKDRIPKNDFRVMIEFGNRLPGWTNFHEIISVLNESNIWWIRKVLFSAQKIKEIHSEQSSFRHISDLEASYYVLDSAERRTLEQIDSIPGLRQDLEDFLKMAEVHES